MSATSVRFRRMMTFALACGTTVWFAAAAVAQQAQPPKPLPKDFDVKGEFEGMAGNYMKCILNGNPTYVRFDQKSTVKITGTATVDFLEKGLFVQCKGTFDRSGKSTEPIKEFVIFTPGPNSPIGAEESGAGNAFDEPTPSKKKGPAPATMAYDVAGRIMVVHNNLVTIDCGRKKLRAEVAADATVKLDATDPSWAAPGDIVKIKGSVDQPPHNVALAKDVSIQLSTQLVPRKKHGLKVADKTPGKTTDKAAEKNTDKTTDKTADKAADKNDKTPKGNAADPKGADPKAVDPKATVDKSAKTADAKKPDDKPDPGK